MESKKNFHLKKIEIFGFKSFAHKTALHLENIGITAIVGPNGCGKSNIADAIRWVLGEQSAKSMRGTRMPDVIFSGTSKRPALNVAEVTLLLHNPEQSLAVPYEEVAVTRRLYRDGESEYLINKKTVRLRDVQDLFLDSGVGKDAFAIFEQGKLDQIIQYTPLERRYIFEEAAGIVRFLHRKKEALKKLEQVDLNMSRVADIHQEVGRQISILEEQATKARAYKEQKQQLDHFEKTLFVKKCEQVEGKITDLIEQSAAIEQQKIVYQEEFLTVQTQWQQHKDKIVLTEKEQQRQTDQFFTLRSQKEIKQKELQSLTERIRESKSNELRWQNELLSLSGKQDQRQAERSHLIDQQRQLETILSQQETDLQAHRKQVTTLEEKVSHLRISLHKQQQDCLQWVQAEAQLDGELKKHVLRLEVLTEKNAQLQSRLQKLTVQYEEQQQQLNQKQNDYQTLSVELEGQQNNFKECEATCKDLQTQIQAYKNNIDQLRNKLSDIRARHKVLVQMREEREGFSAGSKRLLKEANNPKSSIYNKLKELYHYICPEAGYENSVAIALKPYSQTLVAQTWDDFYAVIQFANENKLKDFSIVCLEDELEQQKEQFEANSLASHIASNSLAFKLLGGSFVGEDLKSVQQLRKTDPFLAACLPDGSYIDSKGVYFHFSQSENNVFVREAELRNLDNSLHHVEGQKQSAEQQLTDLQNKLTLALDARSQQEKQIRNNEIKLSEIKFVLQRHATDSDRFRKEEEQIKEEQKSNETSLKQLTIQISELTEKHSAAKEKAVELKNSQKTDAETVDKLSLDLKNEKNLLQTKETQYRKNVDEQKRVVHSLQLLDVRELEGSQQKNRIQEEINSSKVLQEQMQEQITIGQSDLGKIEADSKLVEEKLSVYEQELKNIRKDFDTYEVCLEEVKSQLSKQEENLYKINLQKNQFETTLEALINDLNDRHQLSLEAARQLEPIALSLEQLERKIRGLRHQIESFGDINMTAIEECENHKERFQFLGNQLSDLDISKKELLKIIADLDTDSRRIFQETFLSIKTNFKKNFEILFQGGEADLQFTEAEDILEAGIDITAKPPGKQMRSISLLSGGEKCLTALALLFAIFEVKPAPFCILDEIDAPLDDANVERFMQVVRQFTDRCQFIIITHNKRTMAMADLLCGVSMEEKGISKLITLDFSKKEDLIEVLS